MSRIAYVISQYPAPSHTFIRREIAALRKRGLSILPVSIRQGLAGGDESVPAILDQSWYRLLGSAVRAVLTAPRRTAQTWLAAQQHRSLGIRGWTWAQFHFVEAIALATMLRGAAIDRIHSHFANSGATVAMLAAKHLDLPWSLTLHGISETDSPAGALLAGKIERAEFIACASWFMRAQGMRTVPAEQWFKFHVVRCGVEVDRIKRSEAPPPKSRLRFVTVGRLSPEKGYPGLLEAFQGVVAAGIDAELVIVGDGPLRETLEHQISLAGLAERIALHGALPESETLDQVARADVFVLPSLMEGLPVVLMEAMALEKPVIAALVAGIPELVRDGETGLLFRPADWESLRSCMIRLATDPELRRTLASTSRSCIEKKHDIDRAVEPLARLLDAHGPVSPAT